MKSSYLKGFIIATFIADSNLFEGSKILKFIATLSNFIAAAVETATNCFIRFESTINYSSHLNC